MSSDSTNISISPDSLPPKNKTEFTVFTDGSALNNSTTAYAGWAVYFPEFNHFRSGCRRGTNNMAELHAIMHALWKANNQFKLSDSTLIVYSDSEYSIKILTGVNKATKNLKLINLCQRELKALQDRGNTIKFTHVKAHTGAADKLSKYNDLVDKQARMEARLMKKREEQPNSGIVRIVEFSCWDKYNQKDPELFERSYILCSNDVSVIFYGSIPWMAKLYALFCSKMINVSPEYRSTSFLIKAMQLFHKGSALDKDETSTNYIFFKYNEIEDIALALENGPTSFDKNYKSPDTSIESKKPNTITVNYFGANNFKSNDWFSYYDKICSEKRNAINTELQKYAMDNNISFTEFDLSVAGYNDSSVTLKIGRDAKQTITINFK